MIVRDMREQTNLAVCGLGRCAPMETSYLRPNHVTLPACYLARWLGRVKAAEDQLGVTGAFVENAPVRIEYLGPVQQAISFVTRALVVWCTGSWVLMTCCVLVSRLNLHSGSKGRRCDAGRNTKAAWRQSNIGQAHTKRESL